MSDTKSSRRSCCCSDQQQLGGDHNVANKPVQAKAVSTCCGGKTEDAAQPAPQPKPKPEQARKSCR